MLNKSLAPLFSLTALLGFMVADASAAVLVNYQFTSNSDSATVVGANATATPLTIGVSGTEFGTVGDATNGNGFSGTAPVNNAGAAASSPTRFIRVGNLTNSQASAISDNDYFRFTLTPSSGFAASLTSFTIDIAATGGAFGATVFNTAHWFLMSSADSFASVIGTAGPITQTSNTTSAYTRFTINLSAGAFQNLTSPITFRLYTYSVNNNTAGVNRLDNLIINGDLTAVPEPSAALLMALGGVMLAVRRRKR